MSRKGVYYLARIAKTGNLTSDRITQALLRPQPVIIHRNAWCFVETTKQQVAGDVFVSGRLAKYRPDAQVVVVDPSQGTEIVQQEPNLRVASSTFIYIPKYSGVVFLRVGGQIDEDHFIDRFAKIVERTLNDPNSECELNLIADLKTFAMKLKQLSGIYQISASVVPPNPVFGPLWKPLREYIRKRRTGKMVVRETSQPGENIETKLPEIVEAVANQTTDSAYKPEQEIPIGDAAVLMAADGYGKGHVKGRQDGLVVTIRTADTNKSFLFTRDPVPKELFEKTAELFERIERERHMEHGR